MVSGQSYFGEWTFQLKHLNKNAKIQTSKQSLLLKINEYLLSQQQSSNKYDIYAFYLK